MTLKELKLTTSSSNSCFRSLLSATTGLSPDTWTWLHYVLRLTSQCRKLLVFHSPACCCCSVLFQHLSCSALLLFHTSPQQERLREREVLSRKVLPLVTLRVIEYDAVEVSSQSLGTALSLHSAMINMSFVLTSCRRIPCFLGA